MRRTPAILSAPMAALLAVTLIAGLRLLPSRADQPPGTDLEGISEEASAGESNCPKYSVDKRIFLANKDLGFRAAAKLTEEVAGKLAAPATGTGIDIPRKNFIDDHILGRMEKDGVPSARLCTDEEFVRRVYLDLTGQIPSVRDWRSFAQNQDVNKRAGLVDSLLESGEFVDHMALWFGDLLRNTPQFLYQGRNAYHWYIREFVEKNKPYNQVAEELITAGGDSYESGAANFIAREWTGGPPQDTFDNLAVTAARVFLGTPLECVSCHNGVRHLEGINLWLVDRTRKDFWGMAAFFSGLRVQRQLLERNQYKYQVSDGPSRGYDTRGRGGLRPPRTVLEGEPALAPAGYIFTAELADPNRNLRQELARMITRDMQFARATVNYIWKEFMVVGIVDPPDAFDYSRQVPDVPLPEPWSLQPSHPELLEQLAEEFRASNFNLRHVIGIILKSSAYQLSARFERQWEDRYEKYFARHFVRRMSAEQVHDSIAAATGVLGSYTIEGFGGPVQWARQFPDTFEPRSNGGVAAFLNIFQRGDRNSIERPAVAAGSILQSLSLMNNTFVTQRVRASTRDSLIQRLRSQNLARDLLIEEIFLATLSRMPTADERREATNMIMANATTGPEDLQWVLLNKLDFIFY